MLHFILDGNVSYQWVVSVLCPIKTLLDFITFYCDNGGTKRQTVRTASHYFCLGIIRYSCLKMRTVCLL